MGDPTTEELVALDHASERGLRERSVISIKEPSPGRFEVVVSGMLSAPSTNVSPEDAVEIALFFAEPFKLRVDIVNGVVVNSEYLGIQFS